MLNIQQNFSKLCHIATPQRAHLFPSQRVETLSNFGERSFSKLPPDQIVPDTFGVVKVLEDFRRRAAQGGREDALIPGTVWGFTLM